MSHQLGKPCGAVLPASKRGAAAPTPNGRLVSEGVSGRRTQSPAEPRAERRRSSPTDTRMRVSRAPPSPRVARSSRRRGPGTRPRSWLTARLHGRRRVKTGQGGRGRRDRVVTIASFPPRASRPDRTARRAKTPHAAVRRGSRPAAGAGLSRALGASPIGRGCGGGVIGGPPSPGGSHAPSCASSAARSAGRGRGGGGDRGARPRRRRRRAACPEWLVGRRRNTRIVRSICPPSSTTCSKPSRRRSPSGNELRLSPLIL